MSTDIPRSHQFRAGTMIRAEGQPDDISRSTFIASDDGLDRFGTRIVQDWLDDGRIAAFDANPVVPWGHDYSLHPVGRVVSREVSELAPGRRGLVVQIEWDMDDDEAARVAGKYARGVLSAVSVGFRSSKVTGLRELDKGHPWYAESGHMLSGNELMEISAVTVPGNPRAVAMREAQWLQSAIIESAPDAIREAVRDIIATDEQTRRLIAEAMGDLPGATAERAAVEVVRVSEALGAWSWLTPERE